MKQEEGGDRKPKVQASAWAGTRGRVKTASGFVFPLSTWDAEQRWRVEELDVNTFDKIPIHDLADLLVDLSPEISREASNVLRIANSGWELTAVSYDGRRVHRQGQTALNAFLDLLTTLYGAPDTVFNQYFFSLFLRGAFVAEMVLDRSGRKPIDLIAIDPALMTFRREEDVDRGAYWQLGQMLEGGFSPVTASTVSYVAFDPFPGLPEGRSAAKSALFVCVSLMRTLRDLSRVIAQQGYPRMDIEVNLKELAETLPEADELDAEALQEWADALIAEVRNVYSTLEPDDAYIHTNAVSLNRPVGTVDAGSLGAIDSIMRVLERMAIRALRTMPLLMASDEMTSEGNSARQWEIYVKGILTLQHLAENSLSRLFSLALQAQGIPAKAVFRFAKVRATEEYRDALTLQVKLDVLMKAYFSGLLTLDEVAQELFGKNAARDEPINLALAQTGAPPSSSQETLEGEETQTQERSRGVEEVSRLYASMRRLVDLYERNDNNTARLQPVT